MPISALKLLELNEKYNLIENLSERELLNPEGVGTDLRVGEVYKIIEPGFLGIDERHTPAIKVRRKTSNRKIPVFAQAIAVPSRTGIEDAVAKGRRISINHTRRVLGFSDGNVESWELSSLRFSFSEFRSSFRSSFDILET